MKAWISLEPRHLGETLGLRAIYLDRDACSANGAMCGPIEVIGSDAIGEELQRLKDAFSGLAAYYAEMRDMSDNQSFAIQCHNISETIEEILEGCEPTRSDTEGDER